MPDDLEKSAVRVSLAAIADRMVEAEMMEMGVKRPEAERSVARKAGLSPSAIENLKRGRLKNEEAIGGRIRAAFVSFLERQAARLENELAIARLAQREVDFTAVEIALEAARLALRKE